jgi:hypothetical protein
MLQRHLCAFLAGVIAVAAAACSGPIESPPIQPAPALVTVMPNDVGFTIGDSIQLAAVVTDSAGTVGVDQRVHWTVEPPSAAFTITDSGLVVGHCPGGTATIHATSRVDTTVFGTAHVVTLPQLSNLSIAGIYQAGTGQPAHLDSVNDSIRVTGNVAPIRGSCSLVSEVDLVLHRSSGDTVVDRATLDSTAASAVVQLTLHSAAQWNGASIFPNGDYAVYMNSVYTGTGAPPRSSTINFTIAN